MAACRWSSIGVAALLSGRWTMGVLGSRDWQSRRADNCRRAAVVAGDAACTRRGDARSGVGPAHVRARCGLGSGEHTSHPRASGRALVTTVRSPPSRHRRGEWRDGRALATRRHLYCWSPPATKGVDGYPCRPRGTALCSARGTERRPRIDPGAPAAAVCSNADWNDRGARRSSRRRITGVTVSHDRSPNGRSTRAAASCARRGDYRERRRHVRDRGPRRRGLRARRVSRGVGQGRG